MDEALFLVWPAAFTAAALIVFLRRRPWLIVAAWALASAILVATYPATRGALLQRFYLGVQAVALVGSFGFVLVWFRSAKREITLAHGCVALVLATELIALLIGPWRRDVFEAWPLAQGGYAVVFVSLALLQGGELWRAT